MAGPGAWGCGLLSPGSCQALHLAAACSSSWPWPCCSRQNRSIFAGRGRGVRVTECAGAGEQQSHEDPSNRECWGCSKAGHENITKTRGGNPSPESGLDEKAFGPKPVTQPSPGWQLLSLTQGTPDTPTAGGTFGWLGPALTYSGLAQHGSNPDPEPRECRGQAQQRLSHRILWTAMMSQGD